MSNRLGSSSSLSRGGQVHDAPMLSMLSEHLNLTATVNQHDLQVGDEYICLLTDLGQCLAVSYQPSHVRKAAICLPRLSYLFATVEGLPKPLAMKTSNGTVTLPLYTPNGQVDGHLGLDSHCSKNV
ncbi:hypothetical protein DPMN_020784 [Dreissena polymorpha]|uniref:Uncharacterized protein n=1 Tax=Dreissena polymorpha TaxID=45954 RepID=A0A9D4NLS4_DREPO|nr:hypothetical protein DPMN_020784 [Dreissena polymorpha]